MHHYIDMTDGSRRKAYSFPPKMEKKRNKSAPKTHTVGGKIWRLNDDGFMLIVHF